MSEIEQDLEENIEDGSYYTAAKLWYSEIFHSPIAERNYYSIILVLAIITFFLSFGALLSVFPLSPSVPVVIYSGDVWEETPRITKLTTSSSEDKNTAVMRYMIESYVVNRESYDLASYETRYRNIWTESNDAVFRKYKNEVDASNPASPYRQFGESVKRDVQVLSINYSFDPEMSHASIIFSSSIISVVDNTEIRHTKWQADMTYQYTGLKVKQELKTKNWATALLGLTENSGKDSGEGVTPMKFLVTDYRLKEVIE